MLVEISIGTVVLCAVAYIGSSFIKSKQMDKVSIERNDRYKRRYTEEEIAVLTDVNKTDKEKAKELGRTLKGVKAFNYRLNLEKKQ